MDVTELIHKYRLGEWNNVYTSWKMELFSPKWWALFILVAIAYIVWWKMADKSRLSHLLLFGSFVAVMRVIFDDVVVGIGLYAYKVRLVPLPRSLILNDLTIVPLVYMLIYQFSLTWRSFFLRSAIWSGVWAFVFKPLFVIFGIVVLYDWMHYYTFIAVFLIGIFSRFAFLLVMEVEQGNPVWRAVSDETKAMFHPVMKPLVHNEQEDDK